MMDWSNERFIKVYTRDTADWMTLSFDAQALFMLILRKFDRGGRLDLGRNGAKAIAVAIGHGSLWTRLEPALNELLADGCIQITSDNKTLLARNFVEAQEARKSNAQRQRDFKEDRRSRLADDTKKDNVMLPKDNVMLPKDNVMLPNGNAEKRGVTRGNSSEQNRTEQNRTEKETPKPPNPLPSAGAPLASPAPSPASADAQPSNEKASPRQLTPAPAAEAQAATEKAAAWQLALAPEAIPQAATKRPAKRSATDATEDELQVFSTWQSKLDHPKAKLDTKRITKIRSALTSHGLDLCLKAIGGVASSPWHRENKQDDLELILRDASHIEKYAHLLDRPGPASVPSKTQGYMRAATAEEIEADIADRKTKPVNYLEYAQQRRAALECRT
jgi:hypothetical protein